MSTRKHDKRMRLFVKAGLYLVTSLEVSRGRDSLDIIRGALAAGVRLVQLREKLMPVADFLRLARDARGLTADAGALLIINDRVDVALATDADGVHLGRDDFPVDAARCIAADLIIGASTHSVAEAVDAEKKGASYVNIGPIFPTNTKKSGGGRSLGLEGLREISRAVSVPFTVMGGIRKEHIAGLAAEGARTIAVITAVTAADDPEEAAREMLAEIRKNRKV